MHLVLSLSKPKAAAVPEIRKCLAIKIEEGVE
jgi:hypothetical protein